MNVLIFGATGMVGQGVLRECLLDSGVNQVLSIGRSRIEVSDPKLREIVRTDLFDYSSLDAELSGLDACFFCLGVTSAGMAEQAYERVTYGIAVAAASAVCRLNPKMTFIFVSGQRTDSTEKGTIMWARVKGKAENAILKLPFSGYAFRPGFIEPVHGVKSKTKAYRVFYQILKPVMPMLRRAFPDYVLTTEEIGQAMLRVTRHGYSKRVLESRDIRSVVSS